MSKGMNSKVYREVYKDREPNFINQPSYNDIKLLEANKTSERKRKIRSQRTVVIKLKRGNI